jgi:hypothetical protein
MPLTHGDDDNRGSSENLHVSWRNASDTGSENGETGCDIVSSGLTTGVEGRRALNQKFRPLFYRSESCSWGQTMTHLCDSTPAILRNQQALASMMCAFNCRVIAVVYVRAFKRSFRGLGNAGRAGMDEEGCRMSIFIRSVNLQDCYTITYRLPNQNQAESCFYAL